MPILERQLKGCTYSSTGPIAAFNHDDHAVIVEANKITIYNSESAMEAQAMVEWLNGFLEDSKKNNPEKTKPTTRQNESLMR